MVFIELRSDAFVVNRWDAAEGGLQAFLLELLLALQFDQPRVVLVAAVLGAVKHFHERLKLVELLQKRGPASWVLGNVLGNGCMDLGLDLFKLVLNLRRAWTEVLDALHRLGNIHAIDHHVGRERGAWEWECAMTLWKVALHIGGWQMKE